jgi:hypothetical protein
MLAARREAELSVGAGFISACVVVCSNLFQHSMMLFAEITFCEINHVNTRYFNIFSLKNIFF